MSLMDLSRAAPILDDVARKLATIAMLDGKLTAHQIE